MQKKKNIPNFRVLTIFLAILLAACSVTTPTVPASEIPQLTATPPAESTAESTTQASPTETLSDNLHKITILYTNDEHGYMEGFDDGPGAAEMLGLWKEEFGYSPDGPFLVLSGGDMWTGPAISTWFEGASMVEVMNAMGYQASAVGNHEFDFGSEILAKRTNEMAFPLLGANVRYKSDGKIPTDIGIQPYTIVEVNGVKVGIIGLAYLDTPEVTTPAYVAPFDFVDYEETLREIVPQVRDAGAETIVVPGHICRDALNRLAAAVSDLEISMFGGGHCHELFARETRGMVLLGSGEHMGNFTYAELIYDDETGTTTLGDYGMQQNQIGGADPAVSEIVEEWAAEAAVILDQEIGYVGHNMRNGSGEMSDFITKTWLWSFPQADVALTNTGGIREDIPEGTITIGTIITVLPFDNTIIQIKMTGEQLENTMIGRRNDLAYAGVENVSGRWVMSETGEEIDPKATYVVLVNSYNYSGGGNFMFGQYDPNGYDTSVLYRDPIIDWIEAQGSSTAAPIDDAIEALIGGS
ncbi:MAG: bifunctional UDP-sugar hydrolase/5'-nucleotidase [Anaerolineales bacterium]|jgi:2',3'-cyclic-nucleotide 2'-phosphodiesterase (5'-nucleotidase family)